MKLKRDKEILVDDFEVHTQLNPVLFTEDEKLKPEIRKALLDIALTFTESIMQNDIPINVVDQRIVGSNVSYNYTKYSDIDLHIIVDSRELSDEYNPTLLSLLYGYVKNSFNNTHTIKIKGIEVEVYIEEETAQNATKGSYSLVTNDWILKPEPPSTGAKVYRVEKTPLYRGLTKAYQKLTDEEVDKFIKALYGMRRTALKHGGEFSLGNLVFK